MLEIKETEITHKRNYDRYHDDDDDLNMKIMMLLIKTQIGAVDTN